MNDVCIVGLDLMDVAGTITGDQDLETGRRMMKLMSLVKSFQASFTAIEKVSLILLSQFTQTSILYS